MDREWHGCFPSFPQPACLYFYIYRHIYIPGITCILLFFAIITPYLCCFCCVVHFLCFSPHYLCMPSVAHFLRGALSAQAFLPDRINPASYMATHQAQKCFEDVDKVVEGLRAAMDGTESTATDPGSEPTSGSSSSWLFYAHSDTLIQMDPAVLASYANAVKHSPFFGEVQGEDEKDTTQVSRKKPQQTRNGSTRKKSDYDRPRHKKMSVSLGRQNKKKPNSLKTMRRYCSSCSADIQCVKSRKTLRLPWLSFVSSPSSPLIGLFYLDSILSVSVSRAFLQEVAQPKRTTSRPRLVCFVLCVFILFVKVLLRHALVRFGVRF